ncbi:MAG: histidine phosphatase family protein [Polyangiales bacterium]
MRHLHLIKHGAPRIDPACPSHAWSLSEAGRDQARRAADTLRSAGLTLVVSSEEPKARETAEVLAAALGLPSQAMLGLHEQLRYSAPQLDSLDAFRARVHAVLARPSERSFGDETGDEAHARFRTAVEAVMRVHAGNVAIVAHGTVMALLVARVRGEDPVALWSRLSDLSVLTLPWPDERA